MLLYISISACILALISLFYNWNTNRNSLFLSFLLIIMAIHGVLHSSILSKGPLSLIMIFYNSFSPLYFLTGPLLYFYVRGTLSDRLQLERKDLLHLLPSLIVLVNVAPYWFTSVEYKYEVVRNILSNNDPMKSFDTNWLIPSWLNFSLRGGLLLGYVIRSGSMVLRYHPTPNERQHIPVDQQLIISRFLKILVCSMLLITIGYILVASLFFYAGSYAQPDDNIFLTGFNYISILSFLAIPLSLVVFPRILYGLPADRYSTKTDAKEIRLKAEESAVPFAKSELTAKEEKQPFLELAHSIEHYLREHQPYLEKDFSIDTLARAMEVPRHHLYYCMNRVMNVKFPELRRKLRIEHAKKLLDEGKQKTLSIEGIGNLSGFSSRSNFFTVFKEEVGMTPSEYIEKLSDNP